MFLVSTIYIYPSLSFVKSYPYLLSHDLFIIPWFILVLTTYYISRKDDYINYHVIYFRSSFSIYIDVFSIIIHFFLIYHVNYHNYFCIPPFSSPTIHIIIIFILSTAIKYHYYLCIPPYSSMFFPATSTSFPMADEAQTQQTQLLRAPNQNAAAPAAAPAAVPLWLGAGRFIWKKNGDKNDGDNFHCW